MKLVVFLILFLTNMLFSQSTTIKLTKRTVLDDSGIHLATFYSSPREKLKLPVIPDSNIKFLPLFYSWNLKGEDEKISVMVVKLKDRELLYVDGNNDEDLTNDGEPFVFLKNQNEFILDIAAKDDKQQITKILLKRKIVFDNKKEQNTFDSLFVDDQGDLKQRMTMLFAVYNPEFKGKSGSFYFDDRISLRRGSFKIDNDIYQMGIFDRDNNGLFNDISNEHGDVIIIDLNRDGKLTFHDDNEIFLLNDVFQIKGHNYKLTKIDPYGHFIEITKTSEEPTFRFLRLVEKNQTKAHSTSFELDPSFWNRVFTDLNDKKVNISEFKGKFLLLNFWGTWCAPCVSELPVLKEIQTQYKNRLEIISFLKTEDVPRAKQFIRSKQISWLQIKLDKKNIKDFNIKGYPTNILLSPNGRVLFSRNVVTKLNISNYLD